MISSHVGYPRFLSIYYHSVYHEIWLTIKCISIYNNNQLQWTPQSMELGKCSSDTTEKIVWVWTEFLRCNQAVPIIYHRFALLNQFLADIDIIEVLRGQRSLLSPLKPHDPWRYFVFTLFVFHFRDDSLFSTNILSKNGFLDESNFSNNGPLLLQSPSENKAVEFFVLKDLLS